MTAADFRYDIEGELLTEREVVARADSKQISRQTVRTRLHYGDRTWARLLRAPDKRASPKSRSYAYGRRNDSTRG